MFSVSVCTFVPLYLCTFVPFVACILTAFPRLTLLSALQCSDTQTVLARLHQWFDEFVLWGLYVS